VTVTSPPDGLFSYETGIFADGPNISKEFPHKGANYWQDWEREAHFAFYDKTGELLLDTPCGIKIFGQYSRAIPRKSIAVQFRNKYSTNKIAFPFFEGNKVSVHGSIVLRNCGQDNNRAMMRDPFMHKSVIDAMPDVDMMDARPAIVYINGEYYGIYYIREKINEDYFENKHGIPGDKIDIIKGYSRATAGTNTEYMAFMEQVRKTNVNTPEGKKFIEDNVDLDNWMDYWIAVTYFVNTDSGNIKMVKQQGEGHKWRWVLFDLDWALDPSYYTTNYIEKGMLNPKGHGVSNMFCTDLAIKIMQNAEFKNRFIERYAEHLNTTFMTDRMLGIFDDWKAQIEPERAAHFARWNNDPDNKVWSSYESWDRYINTLRNIVGEKREVAKGHLKSAFSLSNERMAELFPND
jgi:hypothetical protein